MAKSVTLKIGSKVIKFNFLYDRDFLISYNFFALTNVKHTIVDERPDFLVYVYYDFCVPPIEDFKEYCFMLCGEPCSRQKENTGPNIFKFCSGFIHNDPTENVRFSPPMIFWAYPNKNTVSRPLSVVDSGRRLARVELIRSIQQKHPLDIFGILSGNKLDDKSDALKNHAFSLSLEHVQTKDYITEKVFDSIVNESLPIVNGAPNISDYFVEGSYVPLAEIDSIDFSNFKGEYQKRQKALLYQKKLLMNVYNVICYFSILTDDLSLLDQKRPIYHENLKRKALLHWH